MKSTSKQWDSKAAKELFVAIASLKTAEESRIFLRDLCTPEELVDMSDRFQAVKLLSKGQNYREIAQKLSMSTTTVARVAQWFRRGMGGYRLVLARLGHHTPLLARGER